jgi:hypothetical protein
MLLAWPYGWGSLEFGKVLSNFYYLNTVAVPVMDTNHGEDIFLFKFNVDSQLRENFGCNEYENKD